MNETDIIQLIESLNRPLSKRLVIPPGDDMAALKLDHSTVLTATDQIAQDVHFLLSPDSTESHLKRIGYKALARNLSDIAAMATRPVGCLLSMMLPAWLCEAHIKALMTGLLSCADTYRCPLLGGDTGRWPSKIADGKLMLSVTVLSEPWPDVQAISRHGVQAGDTVYVTGHLGGSLIQPADPDSAPHHLSFSPRIHLAHELARTGMIQTMMDLSDGLASDARRMLDSRDQSGSNSAMTLQASAIPISSAARQASQLSGKSALEHALTDGEDYELLFTAPPNAQSAIAVISHTTGTPITPVGEIHPPAEVGHTGQLLLASPTQPASVLEISGFEH